MKLAVGFITYNDLTVKYLPFFLPSLQAALSSANVSDALVVCLDNSDQVENDNSVYIKDNFSQVKLAWAGSNLGFARAYNLLIDKALAAGAEYFLMINPDTILAEDSIKEMMVTLDSDKSLGAIAPRILRWDFARNERTNIIDSDGLFFTSSHRFSDRHQGQEVFPLSPELVFGFTGAAALIRLEALEDVACAVNGKKEYLEELMFMYKEDVDLSYRLQLAGWKIKLLPAALVYHDRTVSPLGENLRQIIKNRRAKSRAVKQWSFLNHWILVLKYGRLPYSRQTRCRTWRYQIMSTIFALFFEPYLMKELGRLWVVRKELKLKRQSLKLRLGAAEMEKMMEK